MAKAKRGFAEGYKTYDDSEGRGSKWEWIKSFHDRMNIDDATRIMNDQDLSPWEILGVSRSATESEIKAAFRKLIIQWHPDRNPHRIVEAEAMSKKIIAAYTILTK